MTRIRLLAVLLLLAALVPAVSAQPILPYEEEAPAPTEFARRVGVGMTRGELLLAAVAPDAFLDAKVWVYWDFRAREVPADDQHDALLVVFKNDRVDFFKFCPSQSVRAFLAHQQAAAGSIVAAK